MGAAGVISNHLKVGIVVSAALVFFVIFTIWLSGKQSGEATTTYSMFFHKDVSGLMLGGPVFFLGVEVGNVTRMEIIVGDPMSVRVDAEVLESTPIDTGTSASLAFQGITGVAVINMVGDPGQNLPLKTPPGFEFPVIEVRDSGLVALLSGAPRIMKKVDALLEKAGKLIGEDNQQLVTDALQNIESLSSALKEKEQAFAALPENLTVTLEEVQATLQELKNVASDVRPGLNETMQNFEKMSERLANLITRLDEWTGTNNTDMNAFLSNGLGQVPELVSDAREALREMEKLLKALREDPSMLLYKPVDDSVKAGD
ncbi:MAG: phospholipid/cholesterol/gamma-HCH transport system substrate-binding protein [Lysobacterales bacterium]